jgi:hypothetical protein
VSGLLGGKLVVEITPAVLKRYQADRLNEKAGPKTVNDEVLLLLRVCGDQGDLIRTKLRRDKALKLPFPVAPIARRRRRGWKRRRSCERRKCAQPSHWIGTPVSGIRNYGRSGG